MTPKRPALRYHGGKWKLAAWILSHMPDHRVYVEPFGGAASVLLQKEPSFAEVYNDLDADVVNFFKVMRDQPDDLQRLLEYTPFARDELAAAYERTPDPVESARRLVVRSFMGFGASAINHSCMTGFRVSTNRGGRAQSNEWSNYFELVPILAERLRTVIIENRDAVRVIADHDSENTLFYVDPPYVHKTRTRPDYHGYAHELTDEDHAELAQLLQGVAGAVMVSGYQCELYDDLFKGWMRLDRPTYANSASKRTESLWLNFEPNTDLFSAAGSAA